MNDLVALWKFPVSVVCNVFTSSCIVDGGRKTVTHTASAPSQNGGAREAEGRAMIPSAPDNPETPKEPKQQKQPTVDQGDNSDLKADLQLVKIMTLNHNIT